ncbi:MAG: PD-(D/E)XK nuclease family protein [Clostridia bacterium]|nr:PD-(D/E)XK nuclease family protein [Clostridia bacterium]
MLTFLTGIDPVAKRKYIGRRLAETVERGEDAVLIVPEQENFERDKELMLQYGARVSNRIRITSFSHFCRDYLESHQHAVKPEADETAVTVLMSLAVRQVSDELEIYGKHYRRPGRVRALVAFYNEIVNAGFDPQALHLAGQKTDGSLKEKTRELALIFTAFEGLLTKRFSTQTDNMNVTGELLAVSDEFRDTDFWFDDFRGFTGAQIRMIALLMPRCRNMYISLTGNSASAGGVRFEHVGKNRRRLIAQANKSHIEVKEENVPCEKKDAGLDHLRRNLFAPAPQKMSGCPDGVHLLKASNRYEECEMIALQARRLLDSGVCRARDIAVLHRDESITAPLLAALKKFDVPVFEDTRRSLCCYPPVRLMLAAVEIAAKGFSTETVLSALKTGMTGAAVEDVSELQNYVYRWQIDGKAWTSAFTANPLGFGMEMDENAASELQRINVTRARFCDPVLRLKASLEKENGLHSCKALYLYLKECDVAVHFRKYAEYLYARGEEGKAIECAGVWDACMDYLDALAGAIGEHPVAPLYFYELLTLILSGGSIGYIPPGIDKMTVGSVDRTRVLQPKAVFIPGFTEGMFPKNTVSAGLLTVKELRALSKEDFPLEKTPEEVYEEERLILYNALNLPEKQLYISYPTALTTGEKTEPSPIIGEIRRIFTDIEVKDASTVPATEKIKTMETAFSQYAAAVRENSPVAATLGALLKEDSVYGARISSLYRAVNGNDLSFSDPAEALRLFGNEISMSASKAETYAKCPFRYFCRYGMGVEKITASKIDARINGLIIHKALEEVIQKYIGKDLKDVTDRELVEDVNRSVDGYCETYLGGTENLPPAMVRMLGRLKNEIFDILSVRRDELTACLFRTAATELSIGYSDGIKGYEVPLPDGGKLVIHGSVDRVDLMTDKGTTYVRVIDYKTGGKDFALSDVFYGLNMQMLIYLFAICDNGKERFGETTPAGILYMPAKASGKTLDRNASEDDIRKRRYENGRMKGIILENADVLNGMEDGAHGVFINAEIREDGTMKGNFLTLQEFSLLHKKIDAILCETGMNIHEGKIPALPVEENGGRTACDYCDYAAICLKEQSAEKRTVMKTDHAQALKRLHEEVDA